MAGRKYDIAIIGASAPGYAAAACAAASGASVALIRAGIETPPVEPPPIPNFVWRMLDLQATDLKPASVSSRIVAVDGGDIVAPSRTAALVEALGQFEPQALSVARSFLDAAARAPSALAGPFYSSADETLDDYFHDERIKTLFAALALMRLGLAGDEPGSAAAFARLGNEAWPLTASASDVAFSALRQAAAARGVAFIDSAPVSVAPASGKTVAISFATGDECRARKAMAASAEIAAALGLRVAGGDAPLTRLFGARATIRILLDETPPAHEFAGDAIHYAVAGREALRAARDAASEGRVPETPPIVFTVEGRTVTVSAPYCPAVFVEDGVERDWSGQDKQALGGAVYDIVKRRLGLKKPPRSVDVAIAAMSALRLNGEVAAPAPTGDEIGAAAKLALELVNGP